MFILICLSPAYYKLIYFFIFLIIKCFFVVKHFKKIFYLLLITLIDFSALFGQRPDDVIDIFNFNARLLEHLTKSGIDSVRESFDLAPLFNDSICFKAAIDHAYYLVDSKDFGHFQNEFPQKENPLKRYEFYGGKSRMVSENLAKIYINKTTTYKRGAYDPKSIYISTYRQASDFLIYAWISSSDHFLNIVSRDFTITGLAALYNEEDNSLICAQVFAVADSTYIPAVNKQLFPYNDDSKFQTGKEEETTMVIPYSTEKNPWNIIYPSSRNSNKVQMFRGGFVLIKENEIYLNLGKNRQLEKIFTDRFDGFAVQYIPYSKFDCSKAKNNSESGEMISQPVYRQQLLKQFNEKDTGDFVAYIGSIPKNSEKSYELNVLVLKNNVVNDLIYTNHLCADKKEINFEMPILSFSPENYLFEPSAEYSKVENIYKAAILEYKDLFEYLSVIYSSVSNKSLINRVTMRLDTIQKFLFRGVQKGEIQFSVIDSLPEKLSENPLEPLADFYTISYNKTLFKYFYLPESISDSLFFEETKKVKLSNNPVAEATYNYYALLINNGNLEYSTMLKADIEKIRDKVPIQYFDKLNLYYHYSVLFEKRDQLNNIKEAKNFISTYYSNYSASADERVNIAEMLILHQDYIGAYSVLAPVVSSDFRNKEASILDLKIFYSGKLLNINYGEYYAKIIEAANYLTDEEWLNLFEGPCRLNLQLLNYEPLWYLYCSKKR